MPKGRPKGSENKRPQVQGFVAKIESMLRKSHPEWENLERAACRFITSDDLKVAFGVWSKLVEYKFGKPIQPIAGAEGAEPIRVIVETSGQ